MRWWIKLLAALIIIALLLCLGWSLVNGITRVLNGAQLNAGEKDPMFAEEVQHPTRPPELDEEIIPEKKPTLDDYAPMEGAPVDKTVDELIREAQQKNSNT